MNFCTRPPWRSTAERISVKYPSRIGRSISGSCCSPRLVDPTRSQNNVEMTFRASPDEVDGLRGVAHSMQNFAPSGLS
jgi:hypothetical protein